MLLLILLLMSLLMFKFILLLIIYKYSPKLRPNASFNYTFIDTFIDAVLIIISQVSNGLMHITDWYPTIVALAQGNVNGLDGVDQTSLLMRYEYAQVCAQFILMHSGT